MLAAWQNAVDDPSDIDGQRAAEHALALTAHVSTSIDDALVKMTLWRRTRTTTNPKFGVTVHLREALIYSAWLDLLRLTGHDALGTEDDRLLLERDRTWLLDQAAFEGELGKNSR